MINFLKNYKYCSSFVILLIMNKKIIINLNGGFFEEIWWSFDEDF